MVEARISMNGDALKRSSATRRDLCLGLASYRESDERRFDLLRARIDAVCEADADIPTRRPRLVEACKASGLVWHGNEALFQAGGPDRLGEALNGLSTICTAHADEAELRSELSAVESALSSSGRVPAQRSGAWLFVLACVVGLRLTRTSAEFLDAVRAAYARGRGARGARFAFRRPGQPTER